MVFVNIAFVLSTIPRESAGMSLTPKEQESLTVIAKEAAREAVEQLSQKLQERDTELRADIKEDARAAVKAELKAWFGDQSPAEHMIQHARIDKFLTWMDGMGKSFWSGLISNILRTVVTGAAAIFVYSKLKG